MNRVDGDRYTKHEKIMLTFTHRDFWWDEM